MALPALQKTWQGGTTLGGVDLVNQLISQANSEATARFALFAIKQALTTFNLNPWTVVSSSDSVTADNTDRWLDEGDLVFRVLGGGVHSWIVLQQANVNPLFQVCFALSNILASDPNRQHLWIVVSPAAGFTGGTITDRPTATDEVEINTEGSSWLGSMTTGVDTRLSCIQSSDGQCTRIVAAGISGPFTSIGFEVPRLPNPNWTNPAVFYALRETIASGNNCFRRAVTQETSPFKAIVTDLDSNPLEVAMRMTGPQRSTGEVIDEIKQSIHFWGGGLSYDGVDAQVDWGTLFDWYWVNRNTGGSHAADGDSFPAQVDGTPQNAAFFPQDAVGPTSSLELAGAAATNLRFTTDMTLECWVDISSLNAGQGENTLFAGKGVFGFGYLFFIKELNGDPNLLRFDIKYSNSNGSLASQSVNGLILVDTWAHVACTREKVNGELKLFLNGVQIGSTLVDDIGADIGVETNNPWQLGNKQDSAAADHHGYMAEARAWSIVRTPAEILANYDKTLVGNEAGLQGYWPLHTDFNDLTANAYHLTGTVGNGTPAPAITARSLPYTGALEDPRTFACVGDAVWGWLDDSATDLELFNWSGTFDIMPQNSGEAETMLGIEGALTTDLGDLSHFYRIKGASTTDAGTEPAISMTGGTGAPTYGLDADYELGAAGKEVMDVNADAAGQYSNTLSNIPSSPMTSTHRSFLVCASFTPSADNDISGTLTNRVVAWNRNPSGDFNGWNLFFQNVSGANPRRMTSRLDFDSGAHQLTSSFAFTYGLPVFAMMVADFAAAKQMMFVAQGANLVYNELTITASGPFLCTHRVQLAVSSGSGTPWGSARGKLGLVNTFEWPAATPSGITVANVKRYLKYTNGFLP